MARHASIFFACVLLVGMACQSHVAAYPSNMWGSGCSKSTTAGASIMGKTVEESSSMSLQLQSAGAAVACGGTITADAGMTFSLSGHSGKKKFLIEAVASAGTGNWGITGGECDKQRTNDAFIYASKIYTVPKSGSVTVRATWATGYGSAVMVTPDCTYTVQATSASETTDSPSVPSAEATASAGAMVQAHCRAGVLAFIVPMIIALATAA